MFRLSAETGPCSAEQSGEREFGGASPPRRYEAASPAVVHADHPGGLIKVDFITVDTCRDLCGAH